VVLRRHHLQVAGDIRIRILIFGQTRTTLSCSPGSTVGEALRRLLLRRLRQMGVMRKTVAMVPVCQSIRARALRAEAVPPMGAVGGMTILTPTILT